MNQPLLENCKEWFEKASNDLLTAQAAKNVKVYDTALFHCQQAAEKAIKGFLTFHDIEFEKDHNLLKHINKANKIESSFELLQEAAILLSPYAVLIRYPGNFVEVNLKTFNVAYRFSKKIYDHVLSILPKDVKPQKKIQMKKRK